MTNDQILKKAIEKAVENGWKDKLNWYEGAKSPYKWWTKSDIYYIIIFSHSFAKAFWGRELVCYDCGEKVKGHICARQFENDLPNFEFHLTQMVLAEEPLKYLEKFL